MKQLPATHALIVVDLQNDFVTGSLPVPDGAAVVPVVNRLRDAFVHVVFTQDWHPAHHGSFAASHPGKQPYESIDLKGLPQTLWPVHCVQGEPGADLLAGLRTENAHIIVKGTDPTVDSYSGFFDNDQRKATGLGEHLKCHGITDVYICGLATDYCVKATAIDAAQLGFTTYLIEDASRGVEIQPGDTDTAIQQMRTAGVCVLKSADIIPSDTSV